MSEQSAAWEYKEESPLREAWKMYLQNRAAVLGLVLLGAVLLLTCVGPLVYPVDPFEMVAPPMSAPGEYGLICGSDYLGRDIFAGIIAGGKATMAVGGFATLVTLCIGITIGALAGYRQGIWDELLMRATEFFQVLPPLLLAMVVVALFSPSLTSVAVSIGIVSWPQNSCGSRKWTTWPPRGRWARETPPSCAGSSCPTPSRRWSSWPP